MSGQLGIGLTSTRLDMGCPKEIRKQLHLQVYNRQLNCVGCFKARFVEVNMI